MNTFTRCARQLLLIIGFLVCCSHWASAQLNVNATATLQQDTLVFTVTATNNLGSDFPFGNANFSFLIEDITGLNFTNTGVGMYERGPWDAASNSASYLPMNVVSLTGFGGISQVTMNIRQGDPNTSPIPTGTDQILSVGETAMIGKFYILVTNCQTVVGDSIRFKFNDVVKGQILRFSKTTQDRIPETSINRTPSNNVAVSVKPNLPATSIVGSTTICLDGNIIENYAIDSLAGYDYEWATFGSSTVGTQTNDGDSARADIQFTTAGTDTVFVYTLVENNNCYLDTTKLTVNVSNGLVLTANSGTTVCGDDTLGFTVSNTPDAISLINGFGTVPATPSDDFIADFANNTLLVRFDTLIVSTTAGCNDSLAITINPTPVLSPSVVIDRCQGDSLLFSKLGFPGSFNATTSPSFSGVDSLRRFTTTGNIDIVFTSSLTGACTDTAFATIEAAPSFVTPELAVCGDTVQQYNVDVNSIFTIATPETLTPNTGTSTTVTFDNGSNVARTATLRATTTTSAACFSEIAITINPAPVLDPLTGSICQNDTLRFGFGNIAGTTFTGGTAFGSIDSLRQFTTAGSVNVIAQVSATGCNDTAVVTVNEKPSFTATSDVVCGDDGDATYEVSPSSSFSLLQGSNGASVAPGPSSGAEVSFDNLSNIQRFDTVVADIGGCKDSLFLTINPAPVLSPLTQTVCEDDTIRFSFGNVASTTFTGGTAFGSIDSLRQFTTAGSVNVIAQVSATGCNDTAVITIDPTPNFISPVSAACADTAIEYTVDVASNFSFVSGSLGTDGISATTNVTTTTASFDNTLPRSLPLVLRATINGGTCFDEVAVSITPAPVLNPLTGSICEGDSISFSTINYTTANVIYSGGTTGSADSVRVFASSGTINVIAVETVSGLGCDDTAAVTVNPAPTFTSVVSPICGNDTATFATDISSTITVQNAGSSNPSILSSTASTALIKFDYTSAFGSTQDTVIATVGGTCADTALVTVNGSPNGSITFSPSGPFCSGDSTQVDGDDFTISGLTSLFAVGQSSVYNGDEITFTIGSTTVTDSIIAEVTNGCTDTVVVTVNPAPVFTSVTNITCGDTTIGFKTNVSASFAYIGPNALSATPVGSDSIAFRLGYTNVLATNVDSVTATSAAGCVSLATFTINPTPQLSAVIAPSICENDFVTFDVGGFSTSGSFTTSVASTIADSTITFTTAANPVIVTFTSTLSGACEDTLEVVVNETPAFTATSVIVCGDEGNGNYEVFPSATAASLVNGNASVVTTAFPAASIEVDFNNSSNIQRFDTLVASISSCTDSLYLTINPAPILNPLTQTVCEDDTIRFGFGNVASTSFSIVSGTALINASIDSLITFTTSGAALIRAATSTCDDTAAITVNAAPTLEKLSGDPFANDTVCAGTEITYNVVEASLAGGTYSLVTGSTGTLSDSTITFGVNNTTLPSGTTVSLVYTAPTATGSCADTLDIFVAPKPEISIVSGSTNDTTLCGGGTLSFVAASGLSSDLYFSRYQQDGTLDGTADTTNQFNNIAFVAGTSTDVDSVYAEYTDLLTYSCTDTLLVTITPGYDLDLTVILEGAYDDVNNVMVDSLRQKGILDDYISGGTVPNLPHTPSMTSALASVPANAVDVVMLDFRSVSDNDVVVDSAYVWLTQDGKILNYNNGQPDKLCGASSGAINGTTDQFFVAVHHRNHLAVMSSTAGFDNSVATSTINLTNITNVFGAGAVMVDAAPMRVAMPAGEVIQDAETNASDLFSVQFDELSMPTGYLQTDVNMSGGVNSLDFDLMSENNDFLYFSTLP